MAARQMCRAAFLARLSSRAPRELPELGSKEKKGQHSGGEAWQPEDHHRPHLSRGGPHPQPGLGWLRSSSGGWQGNKSPSEQEIRP